MKCDSELLFYSEEGFRVLSRRIYLRCWVQIVPRIVFDYICSIDSDSGTDTTQTKRNALHSDSEQSSAHTIACASVHSMREHVHFVGCAKKYENERTSMQMRNKECMARLCCHAKLIKASGIKARQFQNSTIDTLRSTLPPRQLRKLH